MVRLPGKRRQEINKTKSLLFSSTWFTEKKTLFNNHMIMRHNWAEQFQFFWNIKQQEQCSSHLRSLAFPTISQYQTESNPIYSAHHAEENVKSRFISIPLQNTINVKLKKSLQPRPAVALVLSLVVVQNLF
jgi:hypothetical protein